MKHHETSPGQFVPEAPDHTPHPDKPNTHLTASGGQVYTIAWNYYSTLGAGHGHYTITRSGEVVGTASTMNEALSLVGAQ